VGESAFRTPLADAFLLSGKELGYKVRDCNGEFQTGFMMAQGTVRKGQRCSTAKAFLRPVRYRPNLHISTKSTVLKILIDPDTKVAYGVQFEKKGRIYHVSANKEVILSAGSIASPQTLMLSGVGPAAHLQSMGIKVIADLPVGENLQDHVALGGMVFQINDTVSVIQHRVLNVTTMVDYIVSGGTALSTLGGVEALAWVKTKYADPNDDWPDIQFHFAGASVVSDGGRTIRKAHGVRDVVWDEYYKPIANTDTFSIMPVGLRPKSRGYIRLNSTNPYDKPIINPNYYSHPEDLQVMIEGAKIALAIGNSQAFKRYGTKFYGQSFPGCQHHPLGSDDYFGCWIKSYSMTLAHVTGTCKMGPDSDPEAVVNAHLKVRGIRGLRVVDCSVMPLVPSGNTNSIAVSINLIIATIIIMYSTFNSVATL
jgi:glucose dehydrogenase (acceptor)